MDILSIVVFYRNSLIEIIKLLIEYINFIYINRISFKI